MKFLADENFPLPSVEVLRQAGFDIVHVGLSSPGLPDIEVTKMATQLGRTLLTFDSDLGTIAITQRIFPPAGIVYFRLLSFRPETPALVLLDYIRTNAPIDLSNTITVFDPPRVRQRRII